MAGVATRAGHPGAGGDLPSREAAWQLVCEWVQSDSLRKHLLAVEAAMRRMAERAGGDPDRWGLAGLVHDLDWERYPTREDHPYRGVEALRQAGFPEDIVHAVLAHADYTGTARESDMDRALYAVDELTGLITAAALVRPDHSLRTLEVKSVVKKMKEKRFAAGVDRQTIEVGAQELGLTVPELTAEALAAMQGIADQLGLAGEPGQPAEKTVTSS
ncbi:MAG: HDIG domain-containing protein [Limnochordaceae bacterium]|nr:HDIG domain-containing protein [Limnochordaceae bacterium]